MSAPTVRPASMGAVDADAYREQLRQAVRVKTEAEQLERQARDRLRELVPEAKRAGVSMTEIAGILGVSRQALYELIR